MNLLSKTLSASFLCLALAQQAGAADYAVVVNAANSGKQEEVKSLFLKTKTAWSSGEKAVPLGRSGDSPEQVAFNASVLGMSASELAGHWQSEKQKTGQTPPKAVGSEGILFRQIKRKEGGFGVVLASSAVSLPEGLKVLFTFSH